MQRDVVGTREQARQVVHALHFARETPGGVDGERGVITHDTHAQIQAGTRDARADRSETDDAERPSEELAALEALLFAFHELVELVLVGDV